MPIQSKESYKMKVFPKGQVVIPASLRQKHHINIGDRIDVISAPDGILLKPLPKREREQTLTERLFGIFNGYASGTSEPTKNNIDAATEDGFTDGWKK